MTEYETATLALREWALWAAVAQVIVGASQVAIVAYGIRAMRTASAERAAEQDQRAAEQDQRHDEAMTALNAQTESLNAQSHALTALVERTTTALNAQSESLTAHSRALTALVRADRSGTTVTATPGRLAGALCYITVLAPTRAVHRSHRLPVPHAWFPLPAIPDRRLS